MSYEKDLSTAREFDKLRLKLAIIKEDIEMNFFDPVFGVITHEAVIEELKGLLKHFGI